MLDGKEVDIAIPSLNLAIEWNGITHHKPIYGARTLLDTQQRDRLKRQAAVNLGVELVVIEDLLSTPKFVRQSANRLRRLIRQRLDRRS